MRGRARVLGLDSLNGDRTSTVVASDADDTWRFTRRLVCGLLDRCEHAERTLLTRLGWPTQLAAIDDALAGRTAAPPLNPTDRSRVVQALHALAHISQARSHLAIGAEQAHMAAYEALLAGLFANNATAEKILRDVLRKLAEDNGRKGGLKPKKTPAQKQEEWAATEAAARAYRRLKPYHRMRASTEALITTLTVDLHLSKSTLRRHLTHLGIK